MTNPVSSNLIGSFIWYDQMSRLITAEPLDRVGRAPWGVRQDAGV